MHLGFARFLKNPGYNIIFGPQRLMAEGADGTIRDGTVRDATVRCFTGRVSFVTVGAAEDMHKPVRFPREKVGVNPLSPFQKLTAEGAF